MNKEKQIEEMARTMCAYCRSVHNCGLDTCESAYEEAERVANAILRKRAYGIKIITNTIAAFAVQR